MLRAVIFDIDNTLYSYDRAHAAAFTALTEYACEAFMLTPERFQALHGEASRLLEARCGGRCSAIHNRLIRYQLMLELLKQPIEHAPFMAELYWSTLLHAMKPEPGLHEMLAGLKARGLLIGVGTNMTADWQYAKLKTLGILDAIDFMVTSEEVGAEKPDRRLFELCAEKASCVPEACAYVGDNLKGDVLGAMAVGMRAFWYCPGTPAAAVPDGATRLTTLSDLPEVITAQQGV